MSSPRFGLKRGPGEAARDIERFLLQHPLESFTAFQIGERLGIDRKHVRVHLVGLIARKVVQRRRSFDKHMQPFEYFVVAAKTATSESQQSA